MWKVTYREVIDYEFELDDFDAMGNPIKTEDDAMNEFTRMMDNSELDFSNGCIESGEIVEMERV